MADPAPRTILLVWIGRFGDLLVSAPFIAALRRRHPQARMTLLGREYVRELAELLPGLDGFAALPSGPRSAFEFASLILRRHDLCVDLNSAYSRSSGALALLSRAPLRVSFDKFRAGWFYNKTVAAPRENEHMLERYGRLADFFGAPYEPKLQVRLPENAGETARALRARLKLEQGRPIVMLHTGNFKKFDHRWPEDKFVALGRKLIALESRPQLVLTAGPGEETQVLAVANALGPQARYLPAQSAGHLAAFMRECALVAVSATGTMHLACALDVPLLSFHSQYSYECWRPLNRNSVSLTSGDWKSCRAISVESAFDAARELLSKSVRPA